MITLSMPGEESVRARVSSAFGCEFTAFIV